MRQYKFEIIIKEGDDEFWNSIKSKTGCDELIHVMEELFLEWEGSVRLVEYTNGDKKD